jgi:hypothetical protein
VNAGSRVRTSLGDGRVVSFEQDTEWSFGKPYRRGWVLVDLDAGGRERFSGTDLEELEEIEWPE